MKHEIINRCKRTAADAIEKALNDGDDFAMVTIEQKSGYIEIYVDKFGTTATITHLDNFNESTTLERAIESEIDWSDSFIDWARNTGYQEPKRLWDNWRDD